MKPKTRQEWRQKYAEEFECNPAFNRYAAATKNRVGAEIQEYVNRSLRDYLTEKDREIRESLTQPKTTDQRGDLALP